MRAQTSRPPVLIGAIASFLLVLSLSCLPAHATPPQPTPKTLPISAPEALVRSIYTLPDPDFGAYVNPARRPGYFTPRIVERAVVMDRCYLEKYGISEAHFDMIVPGQDYDIGDLRIDLVRQDEADAEVRVRFNRFRQINDPVELRYHLKAMPAGWRIDDIQYAGTSMVAALSKPC